MAAIETTELTKTYGTHRAVDDLNLTVRDGEAFGFLGPNGAGKSTTINVLLGYTRRFEGEVTVLGHDVETASRTARERIGVLPEGYALYDRLTGIEHLRLAARLKRATADVATVLDRVGLSHDAAAKRTTGYSTGMRQRLALGMSIVGDPDLLVLDEPSSGLDPNGVSLLRRLVREEAASGTTVFVSSHILDLVESVCDRVGIIADGRLATVGSIDDLRDDAPPTASDETALERIFGAHTSGARSDDTGGSAASDDTGGSAARDDSVV